jgi:WD40 repeat protein
VAGRTSGYDVFISYSHALDGALAPALQTGLEQFAKPWYRPRALRVFRDTTSLSANPGLWSSIEKALASSDWLVLMASPQAARSAWVDREVAWWLANKSPQRILVMLTEGEFTFDDGEAGEGTSAALPPALRGAFVETPRWVDLRWFHDVDQLDQADPRLQECVADVAAAVRGVDKDLLVGEHIRQHRRTMRLARGGMTALAALVVTTLVAAVIAVGQRHQATTAQHTAVARRMVAEAELIRDQDPRRALQLGVAALRIEESPLTQASLVQTLLSSRYQHTLAGHTDEVYSVAFSPDGQTLATADDNTVILWDLTDRDHPRRLGRPLTGHSVAFSPDGRTLATASNDETVTLWDLSDRGQPRGLGPSFTSAHSWTPLMVLFGRAFSAAFSPDGHMLATATLDERVMLWDLSNHDHPRQLKPLLSHPAKQVGIPLGVDGPQQSLTTNKRGQDPTAPVASEVASASVVFSPDGQTLATTSINNMVIVWDLSDQAHPRQFGPPLINHISPVSAVAFSPNGHILATASADNRVILWNLTDRDHPRSIGSPLTGHTGPVYSVAFSPDGHTLATTSNDQTVVLWDLSPLEKLRRGAAREACTRAGGSLDRETWPLYAPGISYQDTCADR